MLSRRLKVVGVGLNKTGTKTLGTCFSRWGLRHMSLSEEAYDLWCRGWNDTLFRLVAAYDSFEDWPWPLMYKEIDVVFPGTKFVLTRRKDPETWFNSLCKHANRTGPTRFRREIYGYEMPHGHEHEHVQYYLRHLAQVREHFQNRNGQLLEVCWEEGHGWGELSAFLGFECPEGPLPHVNKS